MSAPDRDARAHGRPVGAGDRGFEGDAGDSVGADSGNETRALSGVWTSARGMTALAALCLGLSYALPTVTFQALGSPEETYSIWGGVVSLWDDGNWILAPIVFLFSIVFPVAKLLLLAGVCRRCETTASRRVLVQRLQLLGKWSMLDVLIVALFVGSIQIGIATASSRSGILIFALAIVFSMAAAKLVARALAGARCATVTGTVTGTGTRESATSWAHRLTSSAALVALAGVCYLPLMRVTKGFLFTNEVGLASTGLSLARSGEVPLGLGLLVFVLGASVLRSVLSFYIAWAPRRELAARRAVLLLEEWAMIDVFALALGIVQVKLSELATTRLESGFWVVLVAAVLVFWDGALLRRAAREARS